MVRYAISADSHVVEPPEVFAGLAERFGDEAPRMVRTAEAGDTLVIPARGATGRPAGRVSLAGQRLDPGRERARKEGHKPAAEDEADPEVQRIIAGGYADIRKGILDPAERPGDQELDGVKAEFLYPTLMFDVFGLENTEIIDASFRNYNDWLASYCAEAPDRLLGLPLIPLQDPEAGAAELERVINLGFRGGCIPCSAPATRLYGDPRYDRIWAIAEEAGFPLSLHVGTDAHGGASRPSGNPIGDYASVFSTIQRSIADLICYGVAHRFPRLRFVCTEFNAGWIGIWLDRLDQGYERQSTAAAPYLDLLPSEYWARQFSATFEDDRAAVLTRELVGVRNLMWGNDYPHRDSTWPHSAQVLDEIFRGVPDADRGAMTVDNVATLYRLPPPA